MTDKKVSEITNIYYRTLLNWKKNKKGLYKAVRLGAIAESLDYTESELKFIREKRERELAKN
jgi:hypothetical protein